MGQMCVHKIVLVCLVAALMSACDMLGGSSVGDKPPDPPAGVKVAFVEDGLKISWEPVEGATHYTAFWGGERGQYRDLVDVNGTSVILTGLEPGSSCSYSVTAWNERGESDFADGGLIVYDDDPSRARKYVSRGKDLLEKGLYEDARTYYSTAIGLDPHDPVAYELRAQVHELTERNELARRDYIMAQRVKKQRRQD